MKFYRTPDERFAGIPGFAFAPHYHTLSSGLCVHYLDEGPREGSPVLMLHGEPSWCYLWRHMIAPVTEAGHRVLAPDLVGFGRSDKPTEPTAHSYAAQVAWMREWVEALDLTNITLACQDWGSLIGLRLVAAMPERFCAVVLSNGGLPAGQAPPRAFAMWRAFSRWSPVFPIGRILQAGTRRELSPEEVAAYNAPFPTRASKIAARQYPGFVPLGDNVAVPDQLRAWEVLGTWNKPFLCCFSDGDPITRGGDAMFRERVPGAKGMPHRTLRGGHFIQEDDPDGFSRAIVEAAQLAGAS